MNFHYCSMSSNIIEKTIQYLTKASSSTLIFPNICNNDAFIIEQAIDELMIEVDCDEGKINQWTREWRSKMRKLDFNNIKERVYKNTALSISEETALYSRKPKHIDSSAEFDWDNDSIISDDLQALRDRYQGYQHVFDNFESEESSDNFYDHRHLSLPPLNDHR